MNQFRDIIEINADHITINRFTAAEDESVKIQGSFFEYNNSVFGLGASKNSIWLIVQGKVIKYTETIVSEISDEKDQRSICISQEGTVLFKTTYKPEKPYWNFFSMDDEDVDGFLWMHNIMSSSERKAVLLSLQSAAANPSINRDG